MTDFSEILKEVGELQDGIRKANDSGDPVEFLYALMRCVFNDGAAKLDLNSIAGFLVCEMLHNGAALGLDACKNYEERAREAGIDLDDPMLEKTKQVRLDLMGMVHGLTRKFLDDCLVDRTHRKGPQT